VPGKTIVFGTALLLGSNRNQGVLTSPATEIGDLRRMIEFIGRRRRMEIQRQVEDLPSLVKPISFRPTIL
jgi:hypothetical protein